MSISISISMSTSNYMHVRVYLFLVAKGLQFPLGHDLREGSGVVNKLCYAGGRGASRT